MGEDDRSTGPAIIVTGHGKFASGLVSALELILGEKSGIIAVDFPESDTGVQLRENLEAAVDAAAEAASTVVLCDLKGGSPFNTAFAMSKERPQLEVAYGANLPLLIEFVTRSGSEADAATVLAEAVAEARNGLDRLVVPAASLAGTAVDGDWP